CLQGDTSPFSF
nr:immunoglobulin light chain junction region [Macaca mulatta]MOV80437.1 immunoglobulin light chain junction region [Macaca mulatta]MOV80634.1 immunoglobulin light chain junction region [Macaca mulatta]MOV82747.1 immunoglobulin light chain junction region [Macaca mulatta]MOV82777.1 immunoglobulin light chain junction region [Macaca mulatta]